MDKNTEQKLARSLTAEDTRLIPHLPYLLQDLWELGTPADEVIYLIKKHIHGYSNMKVLDLACGKGAVGIRVAKELECNVKMIDIFPEFIDYARQKAKEYSVEDRCTFAVEDANDSVNNESGWNCVMFMAVGDILGNVEETLNALKRTITPGGYIIIDDTHIAGSNQSEIRYDYEYPTYEVWHEAFYKAGLTLRDKTGDDTEWLVDQNDVSNETIALRAKELSIQYPHLSGLFQSYVESQLNESYDIENNIISSVCLLQWQN